MYYAKTDIRIVPIDRPYRVTASERTTRSPLGRIDSTDIIPHKIGMSRLLQLSDLHFGPPFDPIVGEAALRLADDVAPDAVVVSGDLTQRARREQFAAARAFLDRLPPVPCLVVPGNHDVPLYRVTERLASPLGLYREYISPETNPTLELDDLILFGFDSTSPYRSIVNGRIHKDQLASCRRQFSQARPEQARIVVAHHHFAPAPDYRRDHAMPKAARAMGCFVELGVELILGGHLHRAYVGNSLDFFPGNPQDRGIIIVQCGTTTSRRGIGREREKNTLNVIDIADDAIQIEHYIHDDRQGRFITLSRHIFPRHLHDTDPQAQDKRP